jgi:site-specific recombinase XerD
MLHLKNKSVSEAGEKYLKELATSLTGRSVDVHRAVIHHFTRFLSQFKIDVANLQLNHITEFDEDLERHRLASSTRRAHLSTLNLYLRWLEREGFIAIGTSARLFPNYREDLIYRKQATLPEIANEFLKILGTMNKPQTLNGYKSTLGGFYKEHYKTEKPSHKIDRDDIERYMIYLKERKIKPNNRATRLMHLRRYLYWLHDKRKLKISPDTLISYSDFPRREDHLPKPFPLEADLEIQKRLKASSDTDKLGILLMRRTGVRIGELLNLTYDCVEEDLYGNHFLKVPMGKLNNERVIPLDPETVDLIKRIETLQSSPVENPPTTRYLITGKRGKKRSQKQMSTIFSEVTRDLAIPGRANLHRLRHTFATTLLSAGMSLIGLKTLLGHRDIRMTLGYAAVTQESLRNEYFTALSKMESRYEVTNYKLKVPDLKQGVNRAFYDAAAYVKKCIKEHGDSDPAKTTKLLYRLNSIRHELSLHLKLGEE